MSFLFSKKNEALEHAENTHTYSVFYDETALNNPDFTLHNCYEVDICLSGSGTAIADDKVFKFEFGDMFIFNQFEPHIITHSENKPFASFGAFIHPDYVKSRSTPPSDLSLCFFNKSSNKITLKDKEFTKFEELFVKFRKNFGFGDDILKNSAIDYFLVLLNNYYENLGEVYNANGISSDIIRFIALHIADNINLNSIAHSFSISVNQLCKIFKEGVGTTVSKYISAKRVSMAKKLLTDGKSVAETAMICGFSDYANFIRVFKKLTGTSPGKYAKL